MFKRIDLETLKGDFESLGLTPDPDTFLNRSDKECILGMLWRKAGNSSRRDLVPVQNKEPAHIHVSKALGFSTYYSNGFIMGFGGMKADNKIFRLFEKYSPEKVAKLLYSAEFNTGLEDGTAARELLKSEKSRYA
jgi:hypothetical protein